MNEARNLENFPSNHPAVVSKRGLKAWYTQVKRDLPWRASPSVYGTWLSEIMLQQTRMETGVPRWHAFLEEFPTVNDLAEASEGQVMKAWEGLGYYRRARLLHAAAKEIVHRGGFPSTRVDWQSLPGIGDYTSAAIASIAFGEAVAAVDGNVQRVVSRLFAMDLPVDKGEGKRAIQAGADALLDVEDPGTHNQAMMELGALVCTPRNPQCETCPFSSACSSSGNLDLCHTLPAKTPKKAPKEWRLSLDVFHHGDEVILVQRPGEGIWAGLWSFPESDPTASAGHPMLDEPVRHLLTHKKIEAQFWSHPQESKQALEAKARALNGQVTTWDASATLAMPRLLTKTRDALGQALLRRQNP